MSASEPPPSGIARLAVVVWAVLAGLWVVANIWQVLVPFDFAWSGGLGAVSSGISETVVEVAAVGILVAVALAFARDTHAGALERRLPRTHLYLTLAYVAAGIIAITCLATGFGQSQIIAIAGISVLAVLWTTSIPLQLFFCVAAVTLAMDRYFARSR